MAEDGVSMMEEQQEASVAGTESVRGERRRQVREVMGGKLVGPCDHGDDCGFSLE